jgi:hypothetical protein
MLKRLATVLWWVGILAGGGATSLYGIAVYNNRDCPAILALQTDIEEGRSRATDEYIRTHPALDEMKALLEASASVPDDARNTLEHQRQVNDCRSNKPDPSGVLAGWVFAVLLWCVVFILGGSFLTPPKLDRR